MAQKGKVSSPAEVAALLTGKWYIGPGKTRYCKQCNLPLGSKARGEFHSQCWVQPGEGMNDLKVWRKPGPAASATTVPLTTHKRLVDDGGGLAWTYDFANYLDASSTRQRFEAALSNYSLRLYEVFLLRSNGGDRMVDIAAHLGVTPNVVYDRMRRLRKYTTEWMENENQSDERAA